MTIHIILNDFTNCFKVRSGYIYQHISYVQGFSFLAYDYGRHQATSNYRICVKAETNFYRILQEIIEVELSGLVKLKCVLFKCEWYDPVVNRGVHFNKFGVLDVNYGRRCNKFEHFILASQVD